MSKTVEERIVEMRFDNKQFESGVKQTMTTIDRLKESLKFNNATEGVEKIQNSFNRLDFSIATRGLDNFKVRLSGLQVFANRIIENLADSLYGAIQKVNNGLTAVFRQINEGGAARAQNIEQAKFQLEGLGVAWEDIKGDIDYAVSGTAYGLDVAARAASQLVASNVQLGEEMKFSLRGISGLAAMTNSSYEDIASIFTKVAGQGRMMGEDLNRIAARGINAAAELAKVFNVTEAEIRDMVSKGQIDFKTFAKAMDDAFGEHAKDANKTYAGSLSNVKAALSRLGADIKAAHFETLRKIFVDIIPQLNAFKKAFKPIEDLIIKVEEAIGALIQKIVNLIDVKKAVEKLLPSAKKIGNKILDIVTVIDKAIGEANSLSKVAKEFAYVSREMAMSMMGYGDSVKYISKESEEATEMTEDMTKALQAAKDIWEKGLYGNGQQRVDALEAAGIDAKKTQRIIDAFIQNGYDWDKAIQTVSEDTGDAIDENSERAEKLKKHIKRLAEIFNNIRRIISNVVTSITNVLRVLVSVITGELEESDFGDMIVKATGFLADLSDKLVITREKAEKLRKPLTLIVEIIKKVITVLWKITKGIIIASINIVKFIAFLAGEIRSSADFTEALQKVRDAFSQLKDGNGEFIESVKGTSVVLPVLMKIKDVAEIVFLTVYGVIEKAIATFKKFIDYVKPVAERIYSFFKPFIDIAKNTIKAITGVIRYLFTSIKDGTLLDDVHKKIETLTNGTGGARMAGVILGNVMKWLEEFYSTIATQLKELKLTDIVKLLKDTSIIYAVIRLVGMIKAITSLSTNVPKLFANISKFTASTAKVNKSLARLNTANAIYAIAKSIFTISLAIGVLVGSIITMADYISQGEEAYKAFETALKNMTSLVLAVGLIFGGIVVISRLLELAASVVAAKSVFRIPLFLQIGILIYSIGSTIKNIIRALVTLGNMDDTILQTGLERLKNILINIGGYILIMYLATGIIQKIARFGDVPNMFIQMGVMLLAVSAAITLLVIPIAALAALEKKLGEDKVELAVDFIKSIILSITVMLGVVLALGSILAGVGHNQDLAKMFLDIGLMFLAIGISINFLVTSLLSLIITNKLDPQGTAFALGALLLLIAEISIMIAVIGSNVSSRFSQALWGVVGVMVSLAILVRFMGQFASAIKDEYQLAGAAVGLLGLTAMIYSISNLMKVIGKVKPDRQSIKNVALTVAALALIPLSLSFLKGEDWPAYAAAMAGLTFILLAMGAMLKLMGNAAGNSILATGGAFLMMAAGIAGIAVALALVSKSVDIDKLVALTFSVILLSAALTAMVAVASKIGGVKLIGMALSFAVALIAVAGAIGIVIIAIEWLMSELPKFSDTLGEFGYQIGRGIVMLFGNIIVGIKQGIADIKAQLGVNSPSTVFMEIGSYCIDGFALGIVGSLVDFVKSIPSVLKKFIIDPIKDFFDINSPSVVMETIGQFVGDGFSNGITESISNIDLNTFTDLGENITDALPDGELLGNIFGEDFKTGLIDGISFDSFEGFDGFDASSLLGDTNITDLGNTLGLDLTAGVNEGLKEGIMSIDPNSVTYMVEDLLADESIYETLKAAGIAGVTDAYEEIKRHEEFLAKNPTFEAFKNNIEDYYSEEQANLIRMILNGTNEAQKKSIEQQLAKAYVDKSKLDNIALEYSREFQDSMNKFNLNLELSEINAKNISDLVYHRKYGRLFENEEIKKDVIVNVKAQDSNGNVFTKGIEALQNGSFTLDYDNSSVKTNMDSVSSDISSVITSQADRICQKLEYINNRVNTFDNNHSSRSADISSRITQLETAINNIQLVLDTGAVVGQLVGPMDSALGERQRRKARG